MKVSLVTSFARDVRQYISSSVISTASTRNASTPSSTRVGSSRHCHSSSRTYDRTERVSDSMMTICSIEVVSRYSKSLFSHFAPTFEGGAHLDDDPWMPHVFRPAGVFA